MKAWMRGGAALMLGAALGASAHAADAPAKAPAEPAAAVATAPATPAADPAADQPVVPPAPKAAKGRKAAKARQQPAAGVAAPPPAVAAAPAVDDTAYDPTGRRDPFRPPRVNQLLASGGERTPLQRYELGQLKLVAVIYDTRDPRAVVEDEGGLGYIIKVGTKIGVNDGIVRGIERGKILVEEESTDFFGERRSSEVVLEMASGERGNR